MFYTVSNQYTPYKEITTFDLVCPLTGEKEAMRLVLHQLLAVTPFTKVYHKKPFGVFYRASDKKDIPTSKWTPEMEAFFEQQKSVSPVPNKGWKVTLWGKIFLGIVLLVLMAIIWAIFKGVVLEPRKKQEAFTELTKLPLVGEQYKVDVPIKRYDENGKVTAIGHTGAWVEVLEVTPDSICKLLPIENLPEGTRAEDYVLEQLDAEGTFHGKFKVLDQDRITFEIQGVQSGFQVRTYGNIGNVKRKKE